MNFVKKAFFATSTLLILPLPLLTACNIYDITHTPTHDTGGYTPHPDPNYDNSYFESRAKVANNSDPNSNPYRPYLDQQPAPNLPAKVSRVPAYPEAAPYAHRKKNPKYYPDYYNNYQDNDSGYNYNSGTEEETAQAYENQPVVHNRPVHNPPPQQPIVKRPRPQQNRPNYPNYSGEFQDNDEGYYYNSVNPENDNDSIPAYVPPRTTPQNNQPPARNYPNYGNNDYQDNDSGYYYNSVNPENDNDSIPAYVPPRTTPQNNQPPARNYPNYGNHNYQDNDEGYYYSNPAGNNYDDNGDNDGGYYTPNATKKQPHKVVPTPPVTSDYQRKYYQNFKKSYEKYEDNDEGYFYSSPESDSDYTDLGR